MLTPRLRALCLVLIVCLFSLREEAQTCTRVLEMPTYLEVEHPSCRGPNEAWRICDPGVTLHFTASVPNENPALPFCHPFAWSFDGGSADVTTTEPTVDRVLTAGTRRISASTTGTERNPASHVWIDVYYGIFLVQPQDPTLGNSEYIQVREDHGPLAVEIRRDDARFASTVEYAVSDDLAAPSVVPASGTLTFEPGELVKTIVVQLVNDDLHHSKKRAKITLGKPTNDYGRNLPVLPIYITDDDPVTVHTFGASSYAFDEAAGFASIDVVRTGNIGIESIARVRFDRFGSSTPSEAYVAFVPGEDRKTVVFDIQNAYYTGTLAPRLVCGAILGTTSQPNPWPILSELSVPVTITDDEPVSTLTIAPVEAVAESDATQTINLRLEFSPPWGRGGFLNIRALVHTAGPYDFLLPNSFLPVGRAQEISVPVQIAGDEIPEGDETFEIIAEIENLRASAIVTIHDDDAPIVQYAFDAPSYVVKESPSGVTVGIRRTGDTAAASDVVLHVVPADELPWPAATIPVHFDKGDTHAVVEIPVADGWYTGTRNASLELRIDLVVVASCVIEVDDAETRPVLSVADVSMDEGWRGEFQAMRFTVSLSGAVGVPLTFGMDTEDVTATAADYYFSYSRSATLARGQLSVEIPVTITGDWDREPDETFLFRLSGCCGAMATLGPPATGTIRDDDAASIPLFTLAKNLPRNVSESQGHVDVTIYRTGNMEVEAAPLLRLVERNGSPNGQTPVQLQFQKGETGKTAELGIDDRLSNKKADLATYRAVFVEIVDDGRIHDRVEFELGDNDPISVVSFGDATAMESPIGSELRFPMTINPPWAHSLIVTKRMFSGTATAGTDFDGAEAVVTIPPGTSETTINVKILDDTETEPAETFQFAPFVGGMFNIATSILNATGTIVDDDGDHPSLQPPHLKTSRGATVDIVLDLGSVAQGSRTTALRSSDPAVVAVPENVTIPAGQRSTSFVASAIGRGSASVQAVLPDGLVLESRIDVEEPLFLAVTPASLTIPEGSSRALTIRFDPSSSDDLRVNVGSSDAAIASAPAEVTIPAGATANVAVEGLTAGHAEIELSLPAEYGSTRVVIPVDVVPAVTKRRGVRH